MGIMSEDDPNDNKKSMIVNARWWIFGVISANIDMFVFGAAQLGEKINDRIYDNGNMMKIKPVNLIFSLLVFWPCLDEEKTTIGINILLIFPLIQ